MNVLLNLLLCLLDLFLDDVVPSTRNGRARGVDLFDILFNESNQDIGLHRYAVVISLNRGLDYRTLLNYEVLELIQAFNEFRSQLVLMAWIAEILELPLVFDGSNKSEAFTSMESLKNDSTRYFVFELGI